MKKIPMNDVITALKANGFEPEGEMPAIKVPEQSSETAAEDSDAHTEQLKAYLRRLGDGEDLESVRADFVRDFSEVDASEIDIMGTGFDNTGIIVPQTVAADIPFVTLTYNSATYIYKLPSATNFLAGKVYTYTLTLSARGLELSAISINDWIGEDAEHNPLGGSENITI